MSWFNFLRNSKPKRKARARHNQHSLIHKIENDTSALQQQLRSLQNRVSEHDTVLAEHTLMLTIHKTKLENLEQLVAQPATRPALGDSHAPTNSSPKSGTFDVNGFSTQEKRILQVFFEHPDMTLSYNDIGHALNKSHLTIKNQMNQLGLKADLFTRTIGADNRNRFKLKENLRLQKYIDLG
jgi:hypothetical protein